VNAGVEYCYLISAVDASGNASAPTGVVCATAPGEAVAGGTTTTAPTPPPANNLPSDGLTAPQVDVTNLECTQDFPARTITVDTVLPAGCYLATQDIDIREPANLTIEPGVVIKFSTNRRFSVDQGASLTADGTAEQPIVFTGVEPTPGHWESIVFASSSARNVLDHVQVEYAGTNDFSRGALNFFSIGVEPRVSISNSTFRFNVRSGIHLSDDIPLVTLDGNRYTGNGFPIEADGESVVLLDQRSVYTGNTLDAIVVDQSRLAGDIAWRALPVPYHMQGSLTIDDSFTAEPGTTIQFADDAEFDILPDSSLSLVGTAENPITLSGIDAEPGAWIGLTLFFADDSELRFVNLQHGGGDGRESGLTVTSASTAITELAMDNVSITDNEGVGMRVNAPTDLVEFSNILITGNEGIANVDVKTAQMFNDAMNITGNVVDAIVISDSRIDEDEITLSNTLVPYQVEEIDIDDQSLILEAGVTFLMQQDANISVSRNGAFTTNGTLAQPVSIVGLERTAGFWEGLFYSSSNTALNRLTNTLVADGGGERADDAANIQLSCGNASRLILENSQIENSAGFGLFASNSNCIVEIDAGTTFMNNALGNMN